MERGKMQIEKFFYGNPARYIGKKLLQSDVKEMLEDEFNATGYKDTKEFVEKGSPIKLAESMAKAGAKIGLTPSEVADIMMKNFEEENQSFKNNSGAMFGFVTNALYNMQNEKNKKPNIDETSSSGANALMASSLQEIGGGDIGSVMSGLGPNAIAENTLRTAIATEHIASQQPQNTPAKLR
jgi:hypothetical protein